MVRARGAKVRLSAGRLVEVLVYLQTPKLRRFSKSDRHLINPFVVGPFDGRPYALESVFMQPHNMS